MVFVDRILKISRTKTCFWVIDAVDKCPAKEITAFLSILWRLNAETSMRIFLTARLGGQLGKDLSQSNIHFSEIRTGQDQTMKDIELYLNTRCSPAADSRFWPDLVPEFLSNCRGIFLWVSLIVCELEDAYTLEDMREILRNIPTEIDGFYTRILASITTSPNWHIVKCVLKWVICSPRPLAVEELSLAIKLDIGRTLIATPSQLQAITGHLVSVDEQGRVHIIHETAMAFLTLERDGF